MVWVIPMYLPAIPTDLMSPIKIKMKMTTTNFLYSVVADLGCWVSGSTENSANPGHDVPQSWSNNWIFLEA